MHRGLEGGYATQGSSGSPVLTYALLPLPFLHHQPNPGTRFHTIAEMSEGSPERPGTSSGASPSDDDDELYNFIDGLGRKSGRQVDQTGPGERAEQSAEGSEGQDTQFPPAPDGGRAHFRKIMRVLASSSDADQVALAKRQLDALIHQGKVTVTVLGPSNTTTSGIDGSSSYTYAQRPRGIDLDKYRQPSRQQASERYDAVTGEDDDAVWSGGEDGQGQSGSR